jgi:hypothetical protein
MSVYEVGDRTVLKDFIIECVEPIRTINGPVLSWRMLKRMTGLCYVEGFAQVSMKIIEGFEAYIYRPDVEGD